MVWRNYITVILCIKQTQISGGLLLRPRERLGSIVRSVSVCLSVRQDIAGTTRAVFTNFVCVLPVSVARFSAGTFTIGRIPYRRKGFSSPLKTRPGKGDGSTQRGRSTCMLSTTALLWSPYVIGQTIIFLSCDFYISSFFLFFLA